MTVRGGGSTAGVRCWATHGAAATNCSKAEEQSQVQSRCLRQRRGDGDYVVHTAAAVIHLGGLRSEILTCHFAPWITASECTACNHLTCRRPLDRRQVAPGKWGSTWDGAEPIGVPSDALEELVQQQLLLEPDLRSKEWYGQIPSIGICPQQATGPTGREPVHRQSGDNRTDRQGTAFALRMSDEIGHVALADDTGSGTGGFPSHVRLRHP